MRTPKIIKIGGHDFKVIHKPKIVNKDDGECWGLCDTENDVIYLSRKMNKERKKEIILHECIHAMDSLFDIGIDERKTNLLALLILDLIKTNKLDFLD